MMLKTDKILFKASVGLKNPTGDPARENEPLEETQKKLTADTQKEEQARPSNSRRVACYVIKSEILDGELLALVRHSGVRLPYRYRNIPRYTFDEIRTLLESGIRDPETLRAVHEVKKFGGMTRILPE